MRKQLLLLKTLLVAMLLGVGTSAWAQVSTWTYSTTLGNNTIGSAFSGDANGVVSVVLGTSGQASNWAIASNNGNRGLYNNVDAVTYDGTKTNVPVSGTFMAVTPVKDVDFSVGCYATANNWLYLVNGSTNAKSTLNGGSRWSSAKTLSAGKLLAGVTYYFYSSEAYDKKFAFREFTAKSHENYTIHYQDENGTTIKDDVVYSDLYGATVTASESDMASVEYNDKTYYYKSGNENIVLDTGTNEITLVYASQTAATVTVKYWNDAEPAVEIKDAIEIDTYVGATDISASGEQLPTYIKYSDVKYKYSSGNTPIATVTGDATINLVYTEADTYSYTVKSSTGVTFVSGSDYENETVYFYYPKYLNNNGTLYMTTTDNTGVDANGYKSKMTLDSDNKEYTKTYTAQSITTLVFLGEGEDLFTRATGSAADVRCSKGAGGYASSKTSFVTLPAGTYILMAHNRCDKTLTGVHKFYKGDEEDPFFEADGNGYNSDRISSEFVLNTETTLYMQGGSNTQMVDFIYIYQTAIAAPISEFGKSTFSSTYPVDIANATPAGLKAYKATAADASSVHMVEVTEAVAGMTGSNKTGLVLVGTPSTTYYIPIAASGTEPSGNLLFGWNSSWGNIGATDSGTYFVLSVQNINKVPTVVWAPVKSVSAPLTTGQAGLWADVEISTSRSLRMVFGDNSVTGICDATRLKEKGQRTNSVFNLNGQRVKKAAKGLYIVNGKKYIK